MSHISCIEKTINKLENGGKKSEADNELTRITQCTDNFKHRVIMPFNED